MKHRVFLLSPADCSGKRATYLQNEAAQFELAARLHRPEGAPLGEVFAFISSLYFRGKLAYARSFARPPLFGDTSTLPRNYAGGGIHVITPCDGLLSPEAIVRAEDLRRYAGVPVNADETRYTAPFLRDVEALQAAWTDTEVVLLGSVASPKYQPLLTAVLGERLVFPVDFVGRGDMSRGGLLLRHAAQGRELSYAPVLGTRLRGSRPAKLPPLRKLA